MSTIGRAVRLTVAAVACAMAMSASASAAEIAEWLVNGAETAEAVKTNSESTSAVLLEDTSLGFAVEMMVKEKGTAGPAEKDLTETVTVVSSKAIRGCSTIESIQAVNLPWKTEVYLAGTAFRDRIVAGSEGKLPGWLVECLVLGVKTTDTCTGNISGLVENVAEGGVHLLFDKETEEEAGSCTFGGSKQA